MLLEVPLAMVAWVGVVLIQAIFHFGMLGNNNARRDQNLSPDGAEVDDICFQLDEDEDDEDPPEGLETLLSQTGDEVISVSSHKVCSWCNIIYSLN